MPVTWSREERYELARLRELGLVGAADRARGWAAPASTISRELARNADPRTGAYQPERAHRLAWERQRRPKPSRLSRNPVLRGVVQGLLDRRYSPEQASREAEGAATRTTRRCGSATRRSTSRIYVYPRGELRRELQSLPAAPAGQIRRRRGRRETRGRIVGAVPIGQRPPEVEGRLVPGHHEGDLIMGSKASNSAVGTIVERTTGYLTLLPLPGGHGAAAVAGAVIEQHERPAAPGSPAP